MKKKQGTTRGRPKLKEATKSYTVSLKPSQKAAIEQRHETLTKAIKTTV